MDTESILKKLKSKASQKNREGMARFGINTEKALGVSVYEVRALAKELPKNHKLAKELWNTRVHEAMILASLVEEPEKITEKQMDSWVN